MKISSNSELYSTVKVMSIELKQSGLEKAGSNLVNVLQVSTSPSEIMGEVRSQLRQLSASQDLAALHIQVQVEEALDYLDQALHFC